MNERTLHPARSGRRGHTAVALTLVALLALLSTAAPLLAAPDRPPAAADGPRAGAGVTWGEQLAGGLTALWDEVRRVVFGVATRDKGEKTPGSGIDPDGNKRD